MSKWHSPSINCSKILADICSFKPPSLATFNFFDKRKPNDEVRERCHASTSIESALPLLYILKFIALSDEELVAVTKINSSHTSGICPRITPSLSKSIILWESDLFFQASPRVGPTPWAHTPRPA